MAYRSFNNLGGNVVWRATHSSFFLIREFQFGCKAEVPNFKIHILVEKNVAHFQIPMDDPIAVHILQRGDNLEHEISCLLDCQLLPFFYHLA